MAQMINTNIASLNAQRNLTTSQGSLATSLQRLSSGLRINSAKDDAAGLAIATRLTSQIRGLTQAARNANDGISLAQTAEGAMNEVSNNLQRIRELTVQSANASSTASDRVSMQNEVTSLTNEINRVAKGTDFNGVKLLDGTFAAQNFQVGANGTAQDQISIGNIANMQTSTLGTYQGFTNVAGGAITNGVASALTITPAGGGAVTTIAAVSTEAKSIAAAVNGASVAGLTATANATTLAAVAQTGNTISAGTTTLTLNGVAIVMVIYATTNAATNRASAQSAINAQSAATGVIATDTGSGLRLDAVDGRNITTAFALGGGAGPAAVGTTASDFGIGGGAGTTQTGTFNFSYARPSGSTIASIAIAGAGAAAATGTVAATGTALSAIDITNTANLTANLSAIDAALNSVNSGRADLGATQNRFQSVVANLNTSVENLTASRSRIQDADFATETANLTRAQILQQAGTAMLAQANSVPNGVMTLLR